MRKNLLQLPRSLSRPACALVGLTSGDIFCSHFQEIAFHKFPWVRIGQILPLHRQDSGTNLARDPALAASLLHVEKLAAKCLDDEPSSHGHLPAEEEEGENSKFLQCEQNGGTLFSAARAFPSRTWRSVQPGRSGHNQPRRASFVLAKNN